jgi:predicted ribosome quality control (RQC) complex YloA/Tae2 family protein
MNYTIKLVEHISEKLSAKLSGYILEEVFSSGKNELYFNFNKNENYFGIKLVWQARSCFMFFSEEKFPKPVPHSIKFDQINGLPISTIYCHKNNRSFQLNFLNDFALVFKLYDGLSNILLFKNEDLLSHFRTSIESDLLLKLTSFDKEEAYHKKVDESVLEGAKDLFELMNHLNKKELSEFAFNELKNNFIHQKKADLKQLNQLILKSNSALKQILEAIPFDEIGNIIMANLQTILPKETEVELVDFYRNTPIKIKLKKELNAAQNAEYYYRKSKNQKESIQQIKNRIQDAEIRIGDMKEQLQKIESAIAYNELKPFSKLKSLENKKSELFKEFEFEGFKILVGKSAANNDLLTMKHAHKNDLWLHAKGVSGSHVVIKHISGKPFSKLLIEYAASIAAQFSKSKGSAYVPVIYVERKFVRKPKGVEPGAVVVEKENTVLVKPGISTTIF